MFFVMFFSKYSLTVAYKLDVDACVVLAVAFFIVFYILDLVTTIGCIHQQIGKSFIAVIIVVQFFFKDIIDDEIKLILITSKYKIDGASNF